MVCRVVVPHTYGELLRVARELLRVLHWVGEYDRPGRVAGIGEQIRRWRLGLARMPGPPARIPPPAAGLGAYRALASLGVDLMADEAPPGVRPLGASGDPLVALRFITANASGVEAAAGGLDQIACAARGDGPPGVRDALGAAAAGWDQILQWGADAERLAALLRLPWDVDRALLATRLDRPPRSRGTMDVGLSPRELAAYVRVTDQFGRTWHRGDPLEAALYKT